MAALSLSTTKLVLSPPGLEDLALAIKDGIEKDFVHSRVSVAIPPDLRDAPFSLAAPGLSGHVRVADVGGPQNVQPTPNLKAQYDLLHIAQMMEMSPETGFILGASAGPFQHLDQNTELMPNLAYGSAGGGVLCNHSRYAKVSDDGSVHCEMIGSSTGFGLMGNLVGCDGDTGPALHIIARGRKGNRGYTESIRAGIRSVYKDKLVVLGGVFVMGVGVAKLHVMPDFSSKPLNNSNDLNHWLRFFDTEAPLTCLSVLASGNAENMALRMEHTHCFAATGSRQNSRAGHFHHDIDDMKDVVEYEGWFNVAEFLYRIDQPIETDGRV